jgi:hypothetical protein
VTGSVVMVVIRVLVMIVRC